MGGRLPCCIALYQRQMPSQASPSLRIGVFIFVLHWSAGTLQRNENNAEMKNSRHTCQIMRAVQHEEMQVSEEVGATPPMLHMQVGLACAALAGGEREDQGCARQCKTG